MKRGLQILLAVIGVVMVAAGGQTIILGAAQVLEGGDFSPGVDSEMRFYAAWYPIVGVALLASIQRVESAGLIVRVVGAGFFLAACGRVLSIIQTDTPPTLYVILMVVEFLIPVVIIPWQAAVARGLRTQKPEVV